MKPFPWIRYVAPLVLLGAFPYPTEAAGPETEPRQRSRAFSAAPRPAAEALLLPWEKDRETSGGRPMSLATGDFDGDGTVDLAVGMVSQGEYWVAVYGGRPAGPSGSPAGQPDAVPGSSAYFGPPTLVSVPVAPRGIHGGDFNADGRVDLLVASPGEGTVFLLEGDGLGGFSAPRSKGIPGVLQSMTLEDLDRDGLSDWAFEVSCADRVHTFWSISPQGAWSGVPEKVEVGPNAESAPGESSGENPLGLPAGFDGMLRFRLNADAFEDTVSFREDPPAVMLTLTRPEAVFAVTSAADGGTGSLRQAILDANASAGADAVTFAIGAGPQTITPLTPLPIITDALTLDATTQPGYSGVPLIQISGAAAGIGAIGLDIAGGASVVRGFVLNRFEHGILQIAGPGGNYIEGNYIGTDLAGTSGFANPWTPPNGLSVGVSIADSPNNHIGGTTAATRNLISANWDVGVSITGATSTGNVVSGNYIGTNAGGNAALGNGARGVDLRDGASNTIGGTAAGAGNVISGNGTVPPGADGLLIRSANDTVVQGNLIGLDATGQLALPNTGGGIRLRDASSNRIGGTTAPARNVISANLFDGIEVLENKATSTANQIQGNIVGAAADGITPRPNGAAGIFLSSGSNNSVGGVSGSGNRIAFNAGAGIFGVAGTGNAFMGNSIASNGGLGIDLGTAGITPNDAGDGDTGPNNLQNFPVITVSTCGAATAVQGTLNSVANTTFALEFFASPSCHTSGNGEGAVFLGSSTATTNASGNATFTVSLFGTAPPGHFITATATTSGNTSEFSACRIVTGAVVGEVSGVKWTAGSASGIQWNSLAGALSFSVYRGDMASLPKLSDPTPDSCLRWTGATNATGPILTETPPAGSFYWYLVTASTTCGEGPAGPGVTLNGSGACT